MESLYIQEISEPKLSSTGYRQFILIFLSKRRREGVFFLFIVTSYNPNHLMKSLIGPTHERDEPLAFKCYHKETFCLTTFKRHGYPKLSGYPPPSQHLL